MKFWDREKEKEWLKKFLLNEPNSILFVYGPKSSGKSTLLYNVVSELSNYIYPYFYDLRLIPVSGYKDVIRIFFREKGWKEKIKESIPSIAQSMLRYFEIETDLLEEIFEMKINPFEVMENALRSKKNKTKKTPVIIFDELQKLKEVYMNSPNNQRTLINELFNFFVRLTKVIHLSHVIVMTSDTFFIERVYFDSTLKNTSRYYLVDFFDEETAIEILKNEGIEEKKAKEIVAEVGGVPWILAEIVESEQAEKVIEEIFDQSKARILEFLAQSYEKGTYEQSLEILKKALEREIDIVKDRKKILELVEKEIMYFDPIKGEIKFQTKLDEKVAKEILKNFSF